MLNLPRTIFDEESDSYITLFIAPGTYFLEYLKSDDCIDFSNIKPGDHLHQSDLHS